MPADGNTVLSPDSATEFRAFTIGYEGQTLEAFIEKLKASGVKRVVDVRELPLSRRKGFSKTALRLALAEHAIEYVHLRSAGNPHRSLKAKPELCLALYRQHLSMHPDVVDEVLRVVAASPSALLCFEADHTTCHRSVIVDALATKRSVQVTNL